MEAQLVATIGAGTSAKYYLGQSEYYLGGHEPDGRWLRASVSGADIAIGDIVKADIFEKLHQGLRPDGEYLIPSVKGKAHVGGYDVTFSPPKSFSALWALADDELRKKLERVHEAAVSVGVKALEEHAAFTRSGKDGRYRQKARLTVATFQHGESRPAEHEDGKVHADPNLHTHAVILNLAEKERLPDGTIRHGALDGKALYYWKMPGGAAYHAELAHQVELLGFAIEQVEGAKNGIFEIKGVDPGLKELFSARRRVIEHELDAAGTDSASSPALAAAITLASRSQKVDGGIDNRFAFWAQRAADFGFDAQSVVANALAEGKSAAHLSEAQREDLIASRMAALPRALTEYESSFSYRDLYAAVASALVGTGAGCDRIETELARLIKSEVVVALDHDVWDQAIYSTPEILEAEREISRITRDFAQETLEGADPEVVAALIDKLGLNFGQAEAARTALSTKKIVLIEGAPGSGKTTTAKAIVQGWHAKGYRVIGAAAAWQTANMLREELSIEAAAVDSWLAKAEAGGHFIDRKTVLIVDEAGLASSRQLHAILKAFDQFTAEGRTAPRLVLLGDRNQLQSVGPSGLSLIADALSVRQVETIVRQKDGWLKEAILAFGKGRADEAVEAFAVRDLVHEADGAAATIKAVVDAWEEDQEEKSGSQLLLAKSNTEVRALALEVRRRQRAKDLLQGDDVPVTAVTRSGHTVSLPLAQGDRIRFLTRAIFGDFQVFNGTEAVVENIRAKDGSAEITVQTAAGRATFTTDQIADKKGRAQIAYAVASTIASAQGLTTDRTFLLAGSGLDRHDLYVATSRAREKTMLFVDRKSINKEIVSKQPLSQRGDPTKVDGETRRAFLATRWARAGLKQTALDILMSVNQRTTSPETGVKNAPRRSRDTDVSLWPKDLGLG